MEYTDGLQICFIIALVAVTGRITFNTLQYIHQHLFFTGLLQMIQRAGSIHAINRITSAMPIGLIVMY